MILCGRWGGRYSTWHLYVSFFFLSFYGLGNSSLSLGEIGLFLIFLYNFFFKLKRLPLGFYQGLLLAMLSLFIALIFNFSGVGYDVVRAGFFFVTSFSVVAVIWFYQTKISLMVDALLCSLWVHFIFCILQLITPDLGFYFIEVGQRSSVLGGEFYRCSGLFHNPNSLALYASVLGPLALWRNRIVYLYISLALVLLTFSKTGALLVILMPLFLTMHYKIKTIYFVLFLMILILVLMPLYAPYYELFASIVKYRLTHAESLASRYDVYSNAIRNWSQWFFVGLGPMQDLFDGDQRVHNRILSVAVQYGLPFCFILVSLFLIVLHKCFSFSIYWFFSLLNFAALSLFHTLTYFQAEYVVVWLAVVLSFRNLKTGDK